jgi:putative addiction module component (TIGR02574 family)
VNARTKKVLEEALELSAEDRAVLAAALEASLDEGDEDATPKEIEAAWAEEIQQRVKDVRDGHSHGQPAADAIAEVRARLQSSRHR